MKITTYQSVWDIMKAVLRREFIALNARIKKEEKSRINKFPPKEPKEGRAI